MNNDIKAWGILNTLNGIDQNDWHEHLITEAEHYSAHKNYEFHDGSTIVLAEEGTGDPFPYLESIKNPVQTNESKAWEVSKTLHDIDQNDVCRAKVHFPCGCESRSTTVVSG